MSSWFTKNRYLNKCQKLNIKTYYQNLNKFKFVKLQSYNYFCIFNVIFQSDFEGKIQFKLVCQIIHINIFIIF